VATFVRAYDEASSHSGIGRIHLPGRAEYLRFQAHNLSVIGFVERFCRKHVQTCSWSGTMDLRSRTCA